MGSYGMPCRLLAALVALVVQRAASGRKFSGYA
jgi:hypothetical protein